MSYKGCGSHMQWLLIEVQQITSSLLLSQLKISVLECKSYKGCCPEVLGLPLLGSWHWEIWGCVQSNVCWHQNLQTLFSVKSLILTHLLLLFQNLPCESYHFTRTLCLPIQTLRNMNLFVRHWGRAFCWVSPLQQARDCTTLTPVSVQEAAEVKSQHALLLPVCLLEGSASRAGDTKQGLVFSPRHSSLLHLSYGLQTSAAFWSPAPMCSCSSPAWLHPLLPTLCKSLSIARAGLWAVGGWFSLDFSGFGCVFFSLCYVIRCK